MKKDPTDGKMRAILTRLQAMSDEEFAAFVPQNQKETTARALIEKANQGDIKAAEFVMRVVGDMPDKHMETENDEQLKDKFGLFV
jgi:hypothetical protein